MLVDNMKNAYLYGSMIGAGYIAFLTQNSSQNHRVWAYNSSLILNGNFSKLCMFVYYLVEVCKLSQRQADEAMINILIILNIQICICNGVYIFRHDGCHME